jgi:hypothetical protein
VTDLHVHNVLCHNVHSHVHKWHKGVDLKCHSKELLGVTEAQEWHLVECKVEVWLVAKICEKGKQWARRTFDKYPSAYANMAASKYCKDPNYAKGSKKKKKK